MKFSANLGFLSTSDREEYLKEVGAAAPVFDHNGDVIGAISMWDMTGHNQIENLIQDKSSLMCEGVSIYTLPIPMSLPPFLQISN
tara:strand:- start:92 stop:346 length:255 start_codon:yes stop_codon:yes gene_type:complete